MISFAITVHNEGTYIQSLLSQLVPYCQETGDEIVVLDDYSTDEFTRTVLDTYAQSNDIRLYQHSLNNDFAEHKNYLNSKCLGEYIFQIDADELLSENLLKYLHDIVFNNNEVDLFIIPRVNVVNGLTTEDIEKWNWKVNEKGYVMWPDYQTRLYKNNSDIRWKGKVHEQIVGYKTRADLPAEEEWAIYHEKEIQRQREQNKLYEQITR